jgi:hypothetical protein
VKATAYRGRWWRTLPVQGSDRGLVPYTYFGDDIGHHREKVRWFGGIVGNHVADLVARYGESSEVRQALTDYARVRQGYDCGFAAC